MRSTIPPIRETDLDRILKLIPTEVVVLYAAAVPVLAEAGAWRYTTFVIFLVGLALVPLILYADGRSTGQAASWPQYVVRTLTFAACAAAIAWPFSPWASGAELRWVRSLAVLLVPCVGALLLRERWPTVPAA